MSSDHRKPVVAFVALAFIAAALVGIDRADAEGGRMLAAVIGTSVRVQGDLVANAAAARDRAGGTTIVQGALAFDLGRSAEDDGDAGPKAKAWKTGKDEMKAERFAAKAERKAEHARWRSSKARGKPPWAVRASEHGRSQSSWCAAKKTDKPGRGHKKRGRGSAGRR